MKLRLTCCTVWCLASIFAGYVNAYDPAPRWAQAAVVIDGVLYIHGGKSDPSNAYSYDGAPNVNDLIYLSLLDSFDTSAVPWQLLSNSSDSPASQGPSVSWHSISAFNTTHALLFGGELDPNSQQVLPDRPDSVVLLNCADKLNPSWTTEPQSWGNEPTRRVNHRTTSTNEGKICLTGGEKADGSHLTFSSNYLFDPIAINFTVISDTNGPPDLIGHSAVLLGDGRILIFGGYCPSQQLEVPFSTIWILDTTQDPWTWSQLNISSSNLPTPRRGFAFAVLSNGDIIIHGGRSGDLSITYSDGWILNTSQNPMTWTEAPALSQLGARCDHFAVATGDLTLFGFGYGSSGPAPADVKVYDAGLGSFVSTFSPPSPTPSPTVPGPSTTPKPTHHSTITTSTKHGTTTSHQTTGPTSTTTPGNDDNREHDKKGLAIALGAVFGALGLLLMAIGFYYFRRRSPAHRFMALEGGQGKGGLSLEDSPDREVSSMHDLQDFNPTRGEGLMATLTGAVAALTTSRSRMIPERKDMLADEDTRDFGAWYNERRHDGTGGSSWSLRSILVGGRMRTREPSISSSFGRASRREKSDGMEDTTPLFDEGTSDTHTAGAVAGAAGVSRTPYRRQLSYASSRSYVDPFADPIAEEGNSYPDDGHHHDVPTVGGIPLAPLQEVSSNSNQSHQDLSPGSGLRAGSHLTVSSRNSLSPHVVTSDTSGSSPSFGASSGEPTPPRLASSFFTNDTPAHQNMRRSDSWWARFSRTSFLDRRPSASSKPVPEFRDPHPPPRLLAIEEGAHSPENASPESAKPSSQTPSPEAAGRGMYNTHNRSLTSVKTADTAAIERMAGGADVQMTRSQRRFSSTSEGTSTLFHDRPVSWAPTTSEDGDSVKEQEEAPISSQSSHGSRVTGRTRTYQPEDQDGGVAEDGSTKSRDKGDKSQSANTVRLVQRPSLFVANPDHRLSTSNDSTH